MTNVDVLIVGGGPTGQTLALELSAQQIPFRIINKSAERPPYSRALVIQPRTQELLNRYGNVRELLGLGFSAATTTFAVKGKWVANMSSDWKGITTTQFLKPVVISQAETEKYLDTILAKQGVTIEMGVEAKTITPDADGVTVVLASEDGREETIRAKYVVGADGAHSSVRHAAKSVTFDGEAYQQEFILADVRLETEDPDLPNDRAYFCMDRGVMNLLPLGDGRSRLIVSRPNQPSEHDLSLEDFQKFLNQVFPGRARALDPTWIAAFHLHHRIASNYREGRLLLAGDAAHIHSPAGGQGMNTGIQDAINLGWKLAAVLRGEQPDAFLDTYNEERRPIGEYLLRNSDRMFSFASSQNPVFLFLRNLILPWVLPWVTRSPARVLNSLKFMTQFGVKYRRSSLVGAAAGFRGPVLGGYRAPEASLRDAEGNEQYLQDLLTPGSHHLVLFSGSSSAASEGDLHRAEVRFLEASRTRTKVHTIFADGQPQKAGWADVDGEAHRVYGFGAEPGYVLVRPDSYVAHIGPLAALDELIASL
ncbi:pentachlorophenol 4-monooxygenase [Pestalotiopsis sp. NC0098]|nr:pentachlorophenol 4-monooxygenase [Pestalotiopsis sp. NC0098]